MTAHGKTYKDSMWINYSPDDSTGVDQRVIDFFVTSWADARSRYDARNAKRYAEEHSAEIEASERRQLAELQQKYPPVLR